MQAFNDETKVLKRKINELEDRLEEYEQNNPTRRHKADDPESSWPGNYTVCCITTLYLFKACS